MPAMQDNQTYPACSQCGFANGQHSVNCPYYQPNPYNYYYVHPNYYGGMTGWICPICGKGVSPMRAVCPCKDYTVTCASSNTTTTAA